MGFEETALAEKLVKLGMTVYKDARSSMAAAGRKSAPLKESFVVLFNLV